MLASRLTIWHRASLCPLRPSVSYSYAARGLHSQWETFAQDDLEPEEQGRLNNRAEGVARGENGGLDRRTAPGRIVLRNPDQPLVPSLSCLSTAQFEEQKLWISEIVDSTIEVARMAQRPLTLKASLRAYRIQAEMAYRRRARNNAQAHATIAAQRAKLATGGTVDMIPDIQELADQLELEAARLYIEGLQLSLLLRAYDLKKRVLALSRTSILAKGLFPSPFFATDEALSARTRALSSQLQMYLTPPTMSEWHALDEKERELSRRRNFLTRQRFRLEKIDTETGRLKRKTKVDLLRYIEGEGAYIRLVNAAHGSNES